MPAAPDSCDEHRAGGHDRARGQVAEGAVGGLGQRADEALAKLLDEPLLKTLDIDPESLQSLSAEPKLAGTVAPIANWASVALRDRPPYCRVTRRSGKSLSSG